MICWKGENYTPQLPSLRVRLVNWLNGIGSRLTYGLIVGPHEAPLVEKSAGALSSLCMSVGWVKVGGSGAASSWARNAAAGRRGLSRGTRAPAATQVA